MLGYIGMKTFWENVDCYHYKEFECLLQSVDLHRNYKYHIIELFYQNKKADAMHLPFRLNNQLSSI